jgi:hypothetical protein
LRVGSPASSATRHIGQPVFATNTTGVKVWTARYTPFGGVRTVTGTPMNALRYLRHRSL